MSENEMVAKSDTLLAAAKRRQQERRIVEVDEQRVKVVIFRCGSRSYAFYGSNIREILTPRDIAWVPGLPPYLPGLINVRGDIESVIELTYFLEEGQGGSDPLQHKHIAIAVVDEFVSGVLIDLVEDVVDIPLSAVKPPPSGLPDAVRELVAGEFEYGGETVVLLDARKLATKVAI